MKPLFDKNTTAIFYNQHQKPIQRMLDFDYICKRETPSIAVIVNPNREGMHKAFFGRKEILIPVVSSVTKASELFPQADVLINFASERSSYDVTKEALEIKSIRTIHVMAEGIPENKTREINKLAKEKGTFIIGPATSGAIKPGCFRTGQASGSSENGIMSRLYRPGSVGVVTISGGMSNEIYNMVSLYADGTYEGIAVGGDTYPGSSLLENLLRLESNPEVKMLVCLGEIGGEEEYKIIEAIKDGRLKKPLVMWVIGTIAKYLKTEIQFGHAGSRSAGDRESAQVKNQALRDAGVYVPNSFDDFGELIGEVFEKHVKSSPDYVAPEDGNYNPVPKDYKEALKQNLVRKPASITSGISSDRGDEPTYNKKPIVDFAEKSVGSVINALWFADKLNEAGEKFIATCINLAADHGPAVGTAHNSIVTSRAGNNVVMSLIAGLTTIGPRHGGAIDGTAKWLMEAVEQNMSGIEVITSHKKAGKLIMGIGHRVKTAQHPDSRVSFLKTYIAENFPENKFMSKALEVEAETLKKKNSLILNIDGAIAAGMLDVLQESGYGNEEIHELIEIGALDAIFVLSRSIGMLGHALDQKRLKEPMYRHDTSDILYLNE